MIPKEFILKAQEYAEKELDEYCEEYMIEMMRSLIEDKATDKRIGMDVIGYELFAFLAGYLNGRKVYFVKKPITNPELNRIINNILDILSGREVTNGKFASVCG